MPVRRRAETPAEPERPGGGGTAITRTSRACPHEPDQLKTWTIVTPSARQRELSRQPQRGRQPRHVRQPVDRVQRNPARRAGNRQDLADAVLRRVDDPHVVVPNAGGHGPQEPPVGRQRPAGREVAERHPRAGRGELTTVGQQTRRRARPPRRSGWTNRLPPPPTRPARCRVQAQQRAHLLDHERRGTSLTPPCEHASRDTPAIAAGTKREAFPQPAVDTTVRITQRLA